MPGRHSRPRERSSTTGKRVALAAGAGVAGVAALAAAPLSGGSPAGAATVPTDTPTVTVTDSPTTTESAPSTTSTTSAATTTVTSAPTTTTTTSVAPNYGLQKFRVGVERDGPATSDIPASINTAGSVARVTETASDGTVVRQFDCTTVDETPDDVTDPTFCPGELVQNPGEARGRKPLARTEPTNGFQLNVYYVQRGNTVTVTQTGVVDGLVGDTQTTTLPPCEAEPGGFQCLDGESTKSTDLIFTDKGLPPTAVDDTASTPQDTPVTIDVAANDFSYGDNVTYSATVTGIEIAEQPENGTVVVGAKGSSGDARDAAQTLRIAAGAPTVTYTPNPGFSGKDPFRYTLTTKNGASTATVTVTVPGATTATTPPATTSPSASLGILDESATRTSDGSTTTTTTDGGLAATGDTSVPLVGYGIALLGAGVGAVAVGRHRRGRPGRAH